MFKKPPVIKFSAINPYLPLPTPAKKNAPEWFKKALRFKDGGDSPNIWDPENGNLGMKSCVPFLDSLLTGYIVTLWQDVKVTIVDGVPSFAWNTSPDVLTGGETEPSFPLPYGHSNGYVWKIPFIVQTPPGYSVLVTHPLNRFDLPFTTLSAVVDSDKIFPSGNVPFILKDGFEGVIEKGTPLYQMIPFKRENWSSEVDDTLVEKNNQRMYDMTSVLMGHYKKNIWSRKNYD
jgi:hypothetical protein